MDLPLNINDLLNARTVEWERLEFKAGWNPEKVLHSLCAFANDFHNLGGGYIILGVEENNGRPVLPPVGLEPDQIDSIQQKIFELGHRILPAYHPISAPCEFEGEHILVLWAQGGQTRPYKAPVSLADGNREYSYYIRKGSVTQRARHQDEVELMSLAATVPFDDRINQTAALDDLDLGLVRAYLQQVKSDLFREAPKMDFVRLCRQMNIVYGPDESVRPKNVGLMFFNDDPARFFIQAQIDVVYFPDGPGADTFTEKIFKGPLNTMLQDALAHIRSLVIEEKVVKHPDRAEADRFFNYPYIAIEEALCNAIYHRSYEIREPVEVRILPDRITVGSFPGPDRSISDKDIEKFTFVSRRYRNRRVGEFLKELEMTEGRGTGIPKILRAIEANGSPDPIFHTDEDRSFFVAEFPIHPEFVRDVNPVIDQVADQVGTKSGLSRDQAEILEKCRESSSLLDLLAVAGRSNRTKFRDQVLNPLIDECLIKMTIPDKPRSSKQKYRLTDKGEALLASLSRDKNDGGR